MGKAPGRHPPRQRPPPRPRHPRLLRLLPRRLVLRLQVRGGRDRLPLLSRGGRDPRRHPRGRALPRGTRALRARRRRVQAHARRRRHGPPICLRRKPGPGALLLRPPRPRAPSRPVRPRPSFAPRPGPRLRAPSARCAPEDSPRTPSICRKTSPTPSSRGATACARCELAVRGVGPRHAGRGGRGRPRRKLPPGCSSRRAPPALERALGLGGVAFTAHPHVDSHTARAVGWGWKSLVANRAVELRFGSGRRIGPSRDADDVSPRRMRGGATHFAVTRSWYVLVQNCLRVNPGPYLAGLKGRGGVSGDQPGSVPCTSCLDRLGFDGGRSSPVARPPSPRDRGRRSRSSRSRTTDRPSTRADVSEEEKGWVTFYTAGWDALAPGSFLGEWAASDEWDFPTATKLSRISTTSRGRSCGGIAWRWRRGRCIASPRPGARTCASITRTSTRCSRVDASVIRVRVAVQRGGTQGRPSGTSASICARERRKNGGREIGASAKRW